MARGIVDYEGLNSAAVKALRASEPAVDLPFTINKIGHVVLVVEDLERSVAFYTQVLGFRVSDVYPDTMMPGKMVFMRCNTDHHGIALVGSGKGADSPQRTASYGV
jgi:catechol-2,3-dioxygenase